MRRVFKMKFMSVRNYYYYYKSADLSATLQKHAAGALNKITIVQSAYL